MAPVQQNNPHIKPLEKAMAARYGWQTGSSWRDKLLATIKKKSDKLGMDEMAYCRMAISSPAELEVLADSVSNSETRFFREPEQFQALRAQIIPELIKSRAKERALDFWSAACSTGEEAYSLAILLSECLPAAGDWKTSILATDLRGSAIISASQGLYPHSSIGQIDSALRSKYFRNAVSNGREATCEVIPPVRKMVAFRRANLYDPQFWKNLRQKFDLIVCNNLLLYFHALAAKQTVSRIVETLKPNGFLLVMKNEASYIDHPSLKLEPALPGTYFRKA